MTVRHIFSRSKIMQQCKLSEQHLA